MFIDNPVNLPQRQCSERLARMLHEGLDFVFCRVVWLFSENFRGVARELMARRVPMEPSKLSYERFSSRDGAVKRSAALRGRIVGRSRGRCTGAGVIRR